MSESVESIDSVAKGRVSFRAVIYGATFLSGAAGLIFQVVWQRYLSFLMGSEAKSISLVVAVFLFGLATGYRFWGNITERQWSREKLLKAVGFVELGIAVYGLLFPQIFGVVRALAFDAPDSLVFDLLFTLALLFVPTFLMGATIPLLTAAVPTSAEEVNHCHSRIYGINTLGAFVGALLAGFYLVPKHGLLAALIAAAILDALVGVLFVLNRLTGEMHKAKDVPEIPNAFGSWGIYLLVFVTGAASIGLEVLMIRLVGLSIGSGLFVFPIVVGIVILGLAIGSLSLRRTGMTALRVPRELAKISIILIVLYLSVPYWGIWINHARVSLTSIPSNYGVYLTMVTIFFGLLLLPLMIPMGRLLPVGYALIRKTRSDYGKMCGRVYFANTLGTVVGAVLIGYVLFLWLDLPEIFKVTIAMVLALASFLWWREMRRKMAGVSVLAAVAVFFLPMWNRELHCFNLHRNKSVEDFHFKGLFHIPHRFQQSRVLFLGDDPNATVAVVGVNNPIAGTNEFAPSKAISVNGKPDADTLGDYSNMVLTGMLPYLYAQRAGDLDVAVVGLGSGMTSGALAAADDVRSVTTLEISSSVIKVASLFADENFHLVSNPKSRFVQNDAFRFFTRSDRKFDIIASEPSNPWVVGVESLFTPEFYQLVSKSLNHDGMFCQWVQIYSIDHEILSAITTNVMNEFEHATIFIVGPHDMAIVASHKPLNAPHRARRMAQESTRRALAPMAIDDERVLTLLERYPGALLRAIAKATPTRIHTLEFPWMGHAAAKTLFLGEQLQVDTQILREIGRHLEVPEQRRAAFASFMHESAHNLDKWCKPDSARHNAPFVCIRLQQLAGDYQRLSAPIDPMTFVQRLEAYSRLRDNGFIDANIAALDEMVAAVIEQKEKIPQPLLGNLGLLLSREYGLEWQWDSVETVGVRLAEAGVLTTSDLERLRSQLQDFQGRVALWLEILKQ